MNVDPADRGPTLAGRRVPTTSGIVRSRSRPTTWPTTLRGPLLDDQVNRRKLDPRGSTAYRCGMRVAGTAIAIALLVLACGGRDPAPYVETLDGLDLPSTWQVAQTTVQSQGGQDGCVEALNARCPTVTRYFLVSGELTNVLEQAQIALAGQGFANIEVVDPECDSTLSGPKCVLTAAKEGMSIQVNIYPPGEDVDQLGLSKPDLATVRITLSRQ